MTDSTDAAAAPARGSKRGWVMAIAAAALAGAGGFFATYTGVLGPAGPASVSTVTPGSDNASAPARQSGSPRPFAFLSLDPIVVNVGARNQTRQLRFNADLEVAPEHLSEVSRLRPRILDALNTYLRALEMHELEEPAALVRLRSQMLRRVQIITGDGRVNDLLITEFVFN